MYSATPLSRTAALGSLSLTPCAMIRNRSLDVRSPTTWLSISLSSTIIPDNPPSIVVTIASLTLADFDMTGSTHRYECFALSTSATRT